MLDVVARDAGGGVKLYIGATVHYPLAARYLEGSPSSADEDGWACRKGEEEKQSRYPPRDGIRCPTAAMEHWGRTGPELDQLLELLVGMAADRGRSRALPPARWMQRWRKEFSCGIARTMAQTIADAVGGY